MPKNLTVRRYKDTDCEEISKLFYETVHSVNAKDYSEKQLFAWAKDVNRLQTRRAELTEQYTVVAETDGKIVGFGSITKSGCLDMLFVHKDFQKQGIATALCNELEKDFDAITVYASITAKPFFYKRGYILTKAQEVERSGVKLKNYEMRKNAEKPTE